MDRLTTERRSDLMAHVRSENTKPEMIVRRVVYSLGLRYRLHVKELPGRPDMVLRPRKTVIFVHGCFWHRHRGCSKSSMPKTRKNFWRDKFEDNKRRDRRIHRILTKQGWRVIVIWECETNDSERLKIRLLRDLFIISDENR